MDGDWWGFKVLDSLTSKTQTWFIPERFGDRALGKITSAGNKLWVLVPLIKHAAVLRSSFFFFSSKTKTKNTESPRRSCGSGRFGGGGGRESLKLLNIKQTRCEIVPNCTHARAGVKGIMGFNRIFSPAALKVNRHPVTVVCFRCETNAFLGKQQAEKSLQVILPCVQHHLRKVSVI